MLSQEFPLPEVLRIWDSLLTDESRSKFLIDVCVAMILLIRQDILTNEFPENMKLLQNYPTSMDVHVILSKAAGLSSNIISTSKRWLTSTLTVTNTFVFRLTFHSSRSNTSWKMLSMLKIGPIVPYHLSKQYFVQILIIHLTFV